MKRILMATKKIHSYKEIGKYECEPGADMFLRSLDYENQAKRLEAIAEGKETRAKELLASAKEDRARSKEFRDETERLRSRAMELSHKSHPPATEEPPAT
jgi:hypothetical protein